VKQGNFEVLAIGEIIIDLGFNVYAPTKGDLFDGLQDSLAETGQLVPVIVNKITDPADFVPPEFHLVAGEQRVRALMEGDAETVECKVFENMTELEKAEIHVIENEQRRAPSPMGQARGMHRLRSLGRSTRQIAERYGVSDDTVLRREKLLELPADVIEMIERPLHPLPIHQAVLLTHPKLTESKRRQLARQIAPKTGPVMDEKEAAALIADLVKGPKLPGVAPKEPADKRPVGQHAPVPSSPMPGADETPQPKTAPSPAAQKNAKAGAALQPVTGTVAVSGKIDVDADEQLVISGVLTVKLGTARKSALLYSVKVVAIPIEIPAADTAAVIKLLKKGQPKAAKKK
jgi:ParB/RepB/Spo0J family partition protein